MYVAIVQIPTGKKRSREEAIAAGKASAPMYLGMKGLIRKDYLNGEEGGGGVYVWESREAAEAWHGDPEYKPLIDLRNSGSTAECLLVDGV